MQLRDNRAGWVGVCMAVSIALAIFLFPGVARADGLKPVAVDPAVVALWNSAPSGEEPKSALEAAEKAGALPGRYPNVFAGAAFVDKDKWTLSVFYAASQESEAKRIIASLALPDGAVRLVPREYSWTELLKMSDAVVRSMHLVSEIQVSSVGPDFLLDGVRVGLTEVPQEPLLKRAASVLEPLGVVIFYRDSAFVPLDDDQSDVPKFAVPDFQVTPGVYNINGREWRTTCEPYSSTQRCRTEIKATTVTWADGSFIQVHDWTFNNLTYLPLKRSMWRDNPLGNAGQWTAVDGRQWRTECDTPTTGRNGCRSYALVDVIASGDSGYQWRTQWVYNNQVRFS